MAADGADPTVQECVREGFGKISECKSVGNSEPFLSWFAAFRADPAKMVRLQELLNHDDQALVAQAAGTVDHTDSTLDVLRALLEALEGAPSFKVVLCCLMLPSVSAMELVLDAGAPTEGLPSALRQGSMYGTKDLKRRMLEFLAGRDIEPAPRDLEVDLPSDELGLPPGEC